MRLSCKSDTWYPANAGNWVVSIQLLRRSVGVHFGRRIEPEPPQLQIEARGGSARATAPFRRCCRRPGRAPPESCRARPARRPPPGSGAVRRRMPASSRDPTGSRVDADLGRQVRRLDAAARRAERHGPLDLVPQLPHVAGPPVLREQRRARRSSAACRACPSRSDASRRKKVLRCGISSRRSRSGGTWMRITLRR